MMPLQKQVWGEEFGMWVDTFGVPWMVNINPRTWPGGRVAGSAGGERHR
jgi:hypothetical protein